MDLSLRALLVVAALAACKSEPTTPPDDGGGEELDETLPERGPIEEAATLMARGQAEDALAVIDGALKQSPEDHELHYARGVALQALGRGPEAVEAWRATLERKPGFFPALNGIGAVELDAG
ncbi:MAG: tetratricopeptide repeat protein, partial [Myxococcales bacterium]|nr:tetratricopeptide repeat protein [Myxococcales bacterium]